MRVWGACLRLYINNIWTEHVEYLLFSKENHIDRTCRIFLILKKKQFIALILQLMMKHYHLCRCADVHIY